MIPLISVKFIPLNLGGVRLDGCGWRLGRRSVWCLIRYVASCSLGGISD